MMGILDELMATARERVTALPSPDPHPAPIERRGQRPRPFATALAGRREVAVIAEFKRRSPSLGRIREDVTVAAQVQAYVAGGARAISVLTEPSRFGGSLADLDAAVGAVAAVDAAVPVLMKDFVVDPRQIEVAAGIGAAAVLLIVRCLDAQQLGELFHACCEAGVEALVECHGPADIERALALDPKDCVLGLNGRNLDSLQMDLEGRDGLFGLVPAHRVLVAESGVERPEDVAALRGQADAVLIGTALMRAPDPVTFLREALA